MNGLLPAMNLRVLIFLLFNWLQKIILLEKKNMALIFYLKIVICICVPKLHGQSCGFVMKWHGAWKNFCTKKDLFVPIRLFFNPLLVRIQPSFMKWIILEYLSI